MLRPFSGADETVYALYLYPDIYHTSVAGVNFRRGIKDLAGCRFDATLVAEPKNKYDPNITQDFERMMFDSSN